MIIIEDVRCELISSKILFFKMRINYFSHKIEAIQKMIDLIEVDLIEVGELEEDYQKLLGFSEDISILQTEMDKTGDQIDCLEMVMYN